MAIGEGICVPRTGEGTIFFATARHREGFRKRQRAAGINVSLAEVSGQYLALDAADLLARARRQHRQVRVLRRDGRFARDGRQPRRDEEIARQGDVLPQRINQLLTAAQLDDPTVVLEREPTDLVALVSQVSARLGSDSHPVNPTAPPSLTVDIDPHLVKQVLINLLDNAVRYSPEGGPIDAGHRSLPGARH